MNRFAVITTYPDQGSRNIGDYLITQSLISMIGAIVGDLASKQEWDLNRDPLARVVTSHEQQLACICASLANL